VSDPTDDATAALKRAIAALELAIELIKARDVEIENLKAQVSEMGWEISILRGYSQ